MPDLNLDELAFAEDLSQRAYNCCRANGLNFLSQIILHFTKHQTFLNLRNAGLKTETELAIICKKYLSVKLDEQSQASVEDLPDLTLAQLNCKFQLRKTTKSLLRSHDLDTSQKIIAYHAFKKGFLGLRGATRSFNSELLWLLKQLQIIDSADVDEISKNIAIPSASYTANEWMDDYFEKGLIGLSVRARNVISKSLSKISFKDYKSQFLDKNFYALNIRNAGEKTIEEINIFNQQLLSQISRVIPEIEDGSASFSELRGILRSKKIPVEALMPYKKNILDKSIPLFLMFKREFVPRNINLRYIDYAKYLVDKEQGELKNVEIAEQLEVSKERVRQVSLKIMPELLSFFRFNDFEYQVISQYISYVDDKKEFHDLKAIVNSSFVEELGEFNAKFLQKALATLYSPKYFFLKLKISLGFLNRF